MRMAKFCRQPVPLFFLLHHLHHDDGRVWGPECGTFEQKGGGRGRMREFTTWAYSKVYCCTVRFWVKMRDERWLKAASFEAENSSANFVGGSYSNISLTFTLALVRKYRGSIRFVHQGLILSVCIQLTGATLFGFIIAATRRIVQFIAPIQKVTTTNLQVGKPILW